MSSLRERRRLRTADTIRRAAVILVHAKGLDHVTAEMISDAAGISPRTFFNYFPYKEAALLPPPPVFSEAAIDRFISGQGVLLDDLIGLLGPVFNEIGEDNEFIRMTHEISQSNPKLQILRTNTFHEFESLIAGLITRRLGTANHDKAQHMAALISASIRVGFGAWVEQKTGSAADTVLAKIKDAKTIFDV